MTNEIKIIRVEAQPGASITKGMTNCGPGFILPVVYTLADGRTITDAVTSRRKKDIDITLRRAMIRASEGNLLASFMDDGSYFGTVSKYRIGPAGLVPNPDPAT